MYITQRTFLRPLSSLERACLMEHGMVFVIHFSL